jgi:hypothetical protein
MSMQWKKTKLPNFHTNGIQDGRLAERRFASMTLLWNLGWFRRRICCDLAINQIVIIILVVHIFVIFIIVHIVIVVIVIVIVVVIVVVVVVVVVVVFFVVNKTMVNALIIVFNLNDDIHSLGSRRSLVEPHRLGTRLALQAHGIHAHQLVLSSAHTVRHGRSKLPCALALAPTFTTTSSSSSTDTSTGSKTSTVINPRPKHTTSTDPPFVPTIPFTTQPRPLPQTLPLPSPPTPRSTDKQKHQSA